MFFLLLYTEHDSERPSKLWWVPIETWPWPGPSPLSGPSPRPSPGPRPRSPGSSCQRDSLHRGSELRPQPPGGDVQRLWCPGETNIFLKEFQRFILLKVTTNTTKSLSLAAWTIIMTLCCLQACLCACIPCCMDSCHKVRWVGFYLIVLLVCENSGQALLPKLQTTTGCVQWTLLNPR